MIKSISGPFRLSLSQAVQLIGERTVNGVQDLENFGGVEVSDCIVVSLLMARA
jgi:hypothetical protein